MAEDAMTVAIVMVGHLRSFPEHWHNFQTRVIKPLLGVNASVHTFLCSDAQLEPEAAAGLQLVAQYNLIKKNVGIDDENIWCTPRDARKIGCRISSQPMFLHVSRCFSHALAWSHKHRTTFSHVIRARPDTYWLSDFPIHLPKTHISLRARILEISESPKHSSSDETLALLSLANITRKYTSFPTLCTHCPGRVAQDDDWPIISEPCVVVDDQFAAMPLDLAPMLLGRSK